MTLRERIQTVLNGGVPDLTPFTIYKGLWDVMIGLDDEDIPELGIVVHPWLYEATIDNVAEFSHPIDDTFTEYIISTPVGDLRQVTRQESGYGSIWTVEHYIRHPDDYAVLAYLLEHTSYRPAAGALEEAVKTAGDRGVLMGWMPRAPFQRTWIEYTGIERLTFDLLDYPDVVHHIFDLMLADSRKIWKIVAESPLELLWCPDNITATITGPRQFEEYFLPYYDQAATALHPAGKKLCCHLDGLLSDIADPIARTPLDVVEAYNPPPDGDVRLDEALEIWGDKILWVNFPSSVHLANDEEIEAVTRELVAQAAPGNRFMLGIMENIPDAVGTRSLLAIARALH